MPKKNLFLIAILISKQLISMEKPALSIKTPDHEACHLIKHLEDIRLSRIERFAQEADRKGLTGTEREKFINLQWQRAAILDQQIDKLRSKSK